MITCNGIVGLSLLVGALRRQVGGLQRRGHRRRAGDRRDAGHAEPGAADLHHEPPGPAFSAAQLGLRRGRVARWSSTALFVMTQTVRHRDYFLPVTATARRRVVRRRGPRRRRRPARAALTSLGLLLVALVAVVGLAKVESPADRVRRSASAGLPQSVVGVVIALLVLLPETIAAVRAATRDRVQISLNLALGSAMASIGLTIPAIAVASIWLDGPARARPRRHPDGAAGAHRRRQRR